MSCGCGGKSLPASVQLRLQCASLAAGSGSVENVTRMAQAIYSFAIAGLGDGAEKKLDEAEDSITFTELANPERVQARNAAINSPLMVLRALREPHVATFEGFGIETIGQLVQHNFNAIDGVVPKALEDAIDAVSSPLRSMGLGFGMTTDQVRGWILGESDGETAR